MLMQILSSIIALITVQWSPLGILSSNDYDDLVFQITDRYHPSAATRMWLYLLSRRISRTLVLENAYNDRCVKMNSVLKSVTSILNCSEQVYNLKTISTTSNNLKTLASSTCRKTDRAYYLRGRD